MVGAVHAALASLPDERFASALPHFRLAFSELSPREYYLVAGAAARLAGVAAPILRVPAVREADALLGVRVDALVGAILRQDGLEPGDG